jgi:charged multivesicular body protein 1
MGNRVSLEDEMINLRIVSKQMARSAKKSEKNEKAALEKTKKVGYIMFNVWCDAMFLYSLSQNYIASCTIDIHGHIITVQAIQQGNHEGARIYAQDAIREKNQALNHLRMSSRIDACSSNIKNAVGMEQVTDGMKGVVKGMDKGIASMDIDKISKLKDKFEQQFEDLDVKTQYMEGTMNATTATSTPAEQVDTLISQVADSNNLELGEAFSHAGPVGNKTLAAMEPAVADDLEARPANLKS